MYILYHALRMDTEVDKKWRLLTISQNDTTGENKAIITYESGPDNLTHIYT